MMQISLMGKAEADVSSPMDKAEADVASSPTRQTAWGFKGLRKHEKITHVSNREVNGYAMRFN
jgi:hypothetical protein